MIAKLSHAGRLAVYANETLAGIERFDDWQHALTSFYCKTVDFVCGDETFAPDPGAWVSKLKEQGAEGLKLHCSLGENSHQFASFLGGGGRTIVEVAQSETCDLWEPVWALGDRQDPERRIWNVTYRQIYWEEERIWPNYDFTKCYDDLQ